MKTAQRVSSVQGSSVAVIPLISLVLVASITGCHSRLNPMGGHVPPPATSSINVYRSSDQLPAELRRVGVLPLTADSSLPDAGAGQTALEPVLQAELARRRMFEIVLLSSEQLAHWTGRRHWSAEDALPADFFQRLKEDFGCDAVLFCRLTSYRAYEPLTIGWNLKLVDSEGPQVRWAVDEIFDAGQPNVASAALRYSKQSFHGQEPLADAGTILLSPKRFGQFSLDAVLTTLPTR